MPKNQNTAGTKSKILKEIHKIVIYLKIFMK